MLDFLKGWGSLLIATLALIQPWVISIFKKYILRGIIDNHETGKIEIGYTASGAAIALNGTLRAVGRDQFIRSINLIVTRLKDSSRHLYEWNMFRTGFGSSQSIEPASGFMLTTLQPKHYNILFYDISSQSEIQPYINKVTEEWDKIIMTLYAEIGDVDPDVRQKSFQEKLPKLFDTFSKTTLHTNAYSNIKRVFYWEPGKYQVDMEVNTTRPDQKFSSNYMFAISEAESERLALNTVKIIFDACKRPIGEYNFINTNYQTI